MCKIECKDYYGEEIRIGDYVVLVDGKDSEIGTVLEILQKGKKAVITVREKPKVILRDEDPRKYCIWEYWETRPNRIMKWIEKDKGTDNHIYTKYTDIDGIPLAERMVLEDAIGKERKIYYVAKNFKTGQYCLQSFMGYLEEEGEDEADITRKIEYASGNLQVVTKSESGKVSFLEDYGWKSSRFPPERKKINGEIVFA